MSKNAINSSHFDHIFANIIGIGCVGREKSEGKSENASKKSTF
jgi:hypothetical protein